MDSLSRWGRLAVCLGLVAMPAAGLAQTAASGQEPSPPPGQTAEQPGPNAEAFIQNLGDRALAIIADKSLSRTQRTERYGAILRASFDLQTLGRFVLGRSWRTLTPEQHADYMKLFEALVVKIYGGQLNFYQGEGFRVKKARQEDEKDFVVTSEIAHPGEAPPTQVDWRVRKRAGGLAVIDVVVEGVSQSVAQRQEYAAIIRRDGGKIDGLLEAMRQRLQEE